MVVSNVIPPKLVLQLDPGRESTLFSMWLRFWMAASRWCQ